MAKGSERPTSMAPQDEIMREVVLNETNALRVSSALVSGFALYEVDWMPDFSMPMAVASCLAYFWAAHLGILNVLVSTALYHKANSIVVDVGAWRDRHKLMLNVPWWIFIGCATAPPTRSHTPPFCRPPGLCSNARHCTGTHHPRGKHTNVDRHAGRMRAHTGRFCCTSSACSRTPKRTRSRCSRTLASPRLSSPSSPPERCR